MTSPWDESRAAASGWQPIQVYGMAAACLLVGLAVGYLFRGSESRSIAQSPVPAPRSANAAPIPTLEQMKHMADKKAEPLLAKLKSDPNDADLLMQLGNTYKSTHQFKEAAGYYEKSLQIKPNVAARNELASCLYYEGDVDGAIQQLGQSLQIDTDNANALFNPGLIKCKAKRAKDGAIAAGQQLLKKNPNLPKNKKSAAKGTTASTEP